MSSGLLDTALQSIDKVTKELTKVAQQSVKENAEIIIDMNTETLFSGKDSLGKSLGKYAPRTIEYKKLKGQPYNRITLKDEGDFYEGFFVKTHKIGWSISSKDEKTGKLITDFGKDIFGNTKQDEKEINEEYILSDLLEYQLDNIKI